MATTLQSAMQAVFGTPNVAPVAVTAPIVATPPTPAPAPPAPMDKFSKIWETPPVDPKAPALPKSFLDSITTDVVNNAAAQVDFSKVITSEMLAAVQKGGAEGTAALVAALKSVGQDVYAKGTIAGTAITKRALEEQHANFLKDLPNLIRQHSIKGSGKNKNPLLNNPAVKPVVAALESQLAVQYPDATSVEIGNMAEEWFLESSKAFAPTNPSSKTRTRPEDIDWDTFADTP